MLSYYDILNKIKGAISYNILTLLSARSYREKKYRKFKITLKICNYDLIQKLVQM